MVLLVHAGGCQPSEKSVRLRLESYDPAERIRAIGQAMRLGGDDLVPPLVDRLDDDDPAVRLYAILALEKLTGTRLGYSYADPKQQRRQAVARWRDHVAEAAAAQK